MDNKSLLAIVLCIAILIGYQSLVSYLYPPAPPADPQSLPPTPDTPGPALTEAVPEPSVSPEVDPIRQPAIPPEAAAPPASGGRDVTVETDTYRAVFTTLGGRLESFRLKEYPVTLDPESPLLEIVDPGGYGELPLVVRVSGRQVSLDDAGVAYAVSGDSVRLQAGEQADLVFRGTHTDGTVFNKTYTFSGSGYGIGLEVDVTNVPFQAGTLSVSWLEGSRSGSKTTYDYYGPVALMGRTFKYAHAWDWEPGDVFGPGNIRWAGFTNGYFLSAVVPHPEPAQAEAGRLFFRDDQGVLETRLSLPWSRGPQAYTLYLGPKETGALNAVDPALDRAIDYGWSHFIASPLIALLRLLYDVTGNYGVAIILLTVLVKLVFFPLSNKSFKSMSAMKKLQPQMERLREQYKDDKQKLNQEMMELYKRYHVNPLGGCLPMVVQMPVFIGLYQGLLYAIELRQAPFVGWITDLSQPDRFGALAIPFVDPPGIPVLTLLMGGSMIVQQMMTPMAGDPMQQKMMMLMPVVFTVMFVNFPAGLVLYWLINNILTIAQQNWYQRRHA